MAQRVKPISNSAQAASSNGEAVLRSRSALFDPISLLLCLVGIGISSYLTWTHYADVPIICTTDHSCDTVNRSAYAYFPPNWGVPVAVLGLVGYLVLLALLGLRFRLARQDRGGLAGLDLALFIGTLGGVIFSAYLTAMEIWVIHAICWWCVSSATVMVVLFAISTMRVWNAEPL